MLSRPIRPLPAELEVEDWKNHTFRGDFLSFWVADRSHFLSSPAFNFQYFSTKMVPYDSPRCPLSEKVPSCPVRPLPAELEVENWKIMGFFGCSDKKKIGKIGQIFFRFLKFVKNPQPSQLHQMGPKSRFGILGGCIFWENSDFHRTYHTAALTVQNLKNPSIWQFSYPKNYRKSRIFQIGGASFEKPTGAISLKIFSWVPLYV